MGKKRSKPSLSKVKSHKKVKIESQSEGPKSILKKKKIISEVISTSSSSPTTASPIVKTNNNKVSSPYKKPTTFRLITGSYEHNLLCLSLSLYPSGPIFTPIFHFESHIQSIRCLAWSKRYLVSGSNDEQIRIYDLKKRKELGSLMNHTGSITALRFSNKNNADIKNNKKNDDKEIEINKLEPQNSSETDGKWLLSGSEDGKIFIWRTKDWEILGTLKGHRGKVLDLSIHPSNRLAISVGDDRTLRLWNLITCKKASMLKFGYDGVGELVRWSKGDGEKDINEKNQQKSTKNNEEVEEKEEEENLIDKGGDHFIVGFRNKVLIYSTFKAALIKRLPLSNPKLTLLHLEVEIIDGKQYLILGLSNGSIEFIEFNKIIKSSDNDIKEDKKDVKDSEQGSIVNPTFTLTGHITRVKDFTFNINPENQKIQYMSSVSSDGKIVVWDLLSEDKNQVAVYDSGDRLTCVIAVPEEIEQASTMKRRMSEKEFEGTQSEVESEYESD